MTHPVLTHTELQRLIVHCARHADELLAPTDKGRALRGAVTILLTELAEPTDDVVDAQPHAEWLPRVQPFGTGSPLQTAVALPRGAVQSVALRHLIAVLLKAGGAQHWCKAARAAIDVGNCTAWRYLLHEVKQLLVAGGQPAAGVVAAARNDGGQLLAALTDRHERELLRVLRKQHPEVVRVLVAEAHNAVERGVQRMPVYGLIHHASRSGALFAASQLPGALISAVDPLTGLTPLMAAMLSRNLPLASALLDRAPLINLYARAAVSRALNPNAQHIQFDGKTVFDVASTYVPLRMWLYCSGVKRKLSRVLQSCPDNYPIDLPMVLNAALLGTNLYQPELHGVIVSYILIGCAMPEPKDPADGGRVGRPCKRQRMTYG